MTAQQAIYNAVKERGYVTNITAYDLHQQVLKLLEEGGELAAGLPDLAIRDFEAIQELNVRVRHLFDTNQPRLNGQVNTAVLIAELADVAVVAFVMAELLGVDLQAVAVEKAERDVKRGKRA